MAIDPHAENLRLRTALRDLVALSVIPAAWVGREPPAIAAGLADVLVGSLYLDFAFVRLCDPNGDTAVEVTRGDAWQAFPAWRQRHLASVGQLSRKEIVRDVGGGVEPCRGVVMPIGVNAEGGLVAVACERSDFPTKIDQLLLSVAANHAATAFQNARLIHERKRAEEELREAHDELEIKVAERTAEWRRSEAYLAEAQRLSHTGSWAWNVATRALVHWSQELYRMHGVDPEGGIPPFEAVIQTIHPEDRARALEILERAVRERTEFEVDFRAVLPNGTMKYLHSVGHEAQRTAHVGYWDHDFDAGRVTLSDENCHILGLPLEERIVNLSRWHEQLQELIHPEDQLRTAQATAEALRGGPRYDVEYRVVRPNSEVRIVHSRGDVTWDESGRPRRMFGTMQDITELRHAEDELRASEARFRTFVDHATDAFFLHDERGTILDVNRQACESLGYSREDLIGMTPRDFDVDVDLTFVEQVGEQLAAGEIVAFDTRHRRKDGAVFPVEVRARPFRQGGRRFTVSLVRDITERKRAEQRLVAQQTITQILEEAATSWGSSSFSAMRYGRPTRTCSP
jgi:PAS domain S-box-containing protein